MGRKWLNIKEKKAAKDKNTSRLYAKFSTDIYAAAKSGEPDPDANPRLKMAVDRAKAANVPKNIIERAIEKAKGGSDENYQDLRYEGFGPEGSMVIVDTLTNNVNRTAGDVRHLFDKYGGNLGVNGSASYLFDHTALFVFDHQDPEEIMMALLEAEADIRDVESEDGQVVVYGEPTEYQTILQTLQTIGIKDFSVSDLEMIPKTEISLEGEVLETFEKLIDALEGNEDVQKVYHNVDI